MLLLHAYPTLVFLLDRFTLQSAASGSPIVLYGVKDRQEHHDCHVREGQLIQAHCAVRAAQRDLVDGDEPAVQPGLVSRRSDRHQFAEVAGVVHLSSRTHSVVSVCSSEQAMAGLRAQPTRCIH